MVARAKRKAELTSVSFSELQAFRNCPHQWWLMYVQKWESPTVSAALERGRLWHTVMELHYTSLQEVQAEGQRVVPQSTRDAIRRSLFYDDRGEQSEVQELVEWMYDGYCECWEEIDETWTVVDVESRIVVPLPTWSGRRSGFVLKGFIDLIVRTGSQHVWLVDHKTGSRFPDEMGLALNDQYGMYCWQWRTQKEWVQGVVHNHARTQRNKSPMTDEQRFQRYMTYRSEPELDEIALEAWQTARRAYSLKEHELERTPSTDRCRWCKFSEPCLAGRKGIDEEEYLTGLGFTRRESDEKTQAR